MTEKWELAEVEIAEFRGVKGSLLVKFEPGLNIIGGDNGAGKTANYLRWLVGRNSRAKTRFITDWWSQAVPAGCSLH
jgi:hypothetical protein